MSKYYRAEDIDRALSDWSKIHGTEEALSVLSDLPTIEVNEDCISRKDIMERIAVEYCKWGDDYDALQILGDIEDAPSIETTGRAEK